MKKEVEYVEGDFLKYERPKIVCHSKTNDYRWAYGENERGYLSYQPNLSLVETVRYYILKKPFWRLLKRTYTKRKHHELNLFEKMLILLSPKSITKDKSK